MIKFPNFFVSATVGAGHSRENDVKRTRRALNRTGHGRSPANPSGRYDSSIARNIARLQTDFGLKPNGVIEPGGPTAGTLDMALDVLHTDGKETLDAIRGPYAALGRAGFRLHPDPDDLSASGRWFDRDGNQAADADIRTAIREGEKRGEVKIARLIGGDRIALPATVRGIEPLGRKLFGGFAHMERMERKLKPFGQQRPADSSSNERSSVIEPVARSGATPQTTEPSERPSLLTAASGSSPTSPQQVKPLARPPIIPVPTYKRDWFFQRPKDWGNWTGALRKLEGLTPIEERAYMEIFAAEGGDAEDSSSGAMSGIDPATLKELIGKGLVLDVKSGTHPRNLSLDQRAEAYRSYFDLTLNNAFGSQSITRIGDSEAAAAFADTLFSHGRGEGARVIQRAINTLAPNRVVVDSSAGQQTLDAYIELVRAPGKRQALLNVLADERLKEKPQSKDRIDHFRFQKSSGNTGRP